MGRGEMDMEAGSFGQPSLNRFRLMGAVVVDDEMNGDIWRYRFLNEVKEFPKLFCTMPVVAPAVFVNLVWPTLLI